MTMMLQPRRSGFALPMAILLIGFMTAGLVAAFTRIEAESRTVDNLATEIDAFGYAQDGLDRILASGDTLPSPRTFVYPGGTSVVTITKVAGLTSTNPLDTTLWLIRSNGRTTARAAGRPAGSRTVAQLAFKTRTTLQVLASWTSLSGLNKAGVAGNISGYDECSSAALPGVAVPTGGFSGHTTSVSGTPAIDQMGSQANMASQIKVDWPSMVDPSFPTIQPTHVVCLPGTYGYDPAFPCSSWPTSFPTATNTTDPWPVIVINGTSPLPTNGRGTIIVTGDLVFGGNDKWDGIILVGGAIKDNGSGDISGAVISGLNVLRPSPWPSTVTESSKAEGTKDYTYNSCEVARASSAFARLTPIPNTWLDNWSGAGWTP